MRCAGIPAYDVQRANFHKKMKMMNLQYFCIFFCIFDDFLNFWVCFFCGKLTKPCRHARTFQLVIQQSLASINNKNPKILTLWTSNFFWQNSCRRQINFSMLLLGAELIFAKLPPGAGLFFQSEKRRDPLRAFMPLTK